MTNGFGFAELCSNSEKTKFYIKIVYQNDKKSAIHFLYNIISYYIIFNYIRFYYIRFYFTFIFQIRTPSNVPKERLCRFSSLQGMNLSPK